MPFAKCVRLTLPGTPIRFIKPTAALQVQFDGLLWVTFVRTVRAFESAVLAQPVQRFMRHYMSTGHHHRRILVRGLLFGNGADED